MGNYSAVIAPTRNIGTMRLSITQTSGMWCDTDPNLCARIRRITSPHIVIDAMGGFLSADFVVPPEEAVGWIGHLRKHATAWMFDGQTPIFYGQLDSVTVQNDGSVLCAVNGFWQVATASRMREVWDDWDMTRLKTAPNNVRNGTVNVDSDGTMTLAFPKGVTAVANDRVSVDYFLFGEPTGTRDGKKLTGFEVDISAISTGGNFQFQVIGKSSPNSALADVLLTTTATGSTKQTATVNTWPASDGYRLLRFSWECSTGTTTTQDRTVTLDRLRVTTTQGLFGAFANASIDTAQIARNIFNQKGALDRYDIPLDFWRQEDVNSQFLYGQNGSFSDGSSAGDPVIGMGTCTNTGTTITGFNVVDWTAPTDILIALSSMDGCQVGFYFPVNQRSGYFFGGPGDLPNNNSLYPSQWLSSPPMLQYKPWSALSSPDYFVSLQEGAELQPDQTSQPLLNAEYVNYQTLEGYAASVVTEDTTLGSPNYAAYNNWLTANGYRRAEDYTVQPSIGTTDGSNASTAASIGLQLTRLRNQPSAAGTITIRKDSTSRYPIIDSNGAVPTKLALLRPGVYRVMDIPTSKRVAVGRATHLEWWGETFDTPEYVQVSLAPPGQMRWDRRLAQLQWRSDHTYIKKK